MNDFQGSSTNPLGIPNIKVVGTDGEERVRPDVIQFVTSLSQLAQMVRMRKLEESKIPSGLKSMQLTVTDQLYTLNMYPYWIAFTLQNADTGGGVFFKINELEGDITEEAPLDRYESIRIDFDYPIIYRLYLQSMPGTTSYVRIYAELGQSKEQI